VGDDLVLDCTLRESLDTEDELDVLAHSAALAEQPAAEADVLLVDAGPPLPQVGELKKLRAANQSALMIVVASEIDADVRELGNALGAVGYVKKDEGLHDIAALVVALASLSR
jgi:DNA-binding NarL/FixJ family response regulator